MGRNPDQNQRLRDEGRARILSAALAEFAARGLAATRIADVAARAGVSQGLLYHYFPSKDAMYVALVRRALEGMGDAARALERLPLAPHEKIRRALTELLRLLDADDDDFASLFYLTTQASLTAAIPEEARHLLDTRRDAPYEAIGRILRAGQAEGTIRDHDAAELALVFWSTVRGLALQRAMLGPRYRAPAAEVLLPLFLREVPP